jgi:hypothetical protein
LLLEFERLPHAVIPLGVSLCETPCLDTRIESKRATVMGALRGRSPRRGGRPRPQGLAEGETSLFLIMNMIVFEFDF